MSVSHHSTTAFTIANGEWMAIWQLILNCLNCIPHVIFIILKFQVHKCDRTEGAVGMPTSIMDLKRLATCQSNIEFPPQWQVPEFHLANH